MMDNRKHETRQRGYRRLSACIFLLFALLTLPATAAKLILRLQAANPTDKPRPVEIRTSLPERITTNDIISLAGLNLGYDVQSDTYYVYSTITLGPKEIAVRDVELDDIWQLDEASLKNLASRSAQMVPMLEATVHAADALEAGARVESGVAAMLARQEENRISRVSPTKHIQAYEANLKTMQDVKQHVGQIENLIMAAGMNPGERLIGEDKSALPPRRDAHLPVAFGEAVVKITVMNSSPVQTRQIPVKWELPPEVMVEDVLDAGGLSIRYDAKDKLTVVYADALEIGPQESKTFDVRIRDKWNVNGPRIAFLQGKVGELRVTTSGRNSLGAVENMLNDAEMRLTATATEVGPDALSPAYIAFYRRQADRLDGIERDLNRIDSALRPLETKRGFAIPAPDKKTTWLVIYAILGFLAVMSLLFFFRWFVKS